MSDFDSIFTSVRSEVAAVAYFAAQERSMPPAKFLAEHTGAMRVDHMSFEAYAKVLAQWRLMMAEAMAAALCRKYHLESFPEETKEAAAECAPPTDVDVRQIP